ncbi:MAG: NAD-dependent epimerase/dehydratase family protein [Halorubrum sp.]
MTVLLTGAHGTVGTAVTATSAYDHVLLDREPAPDELGDGSPHPHRGRETVVVDVGAEGAVGGLTDAMAEHGVTAVVHLAGDPTPSATYPSVERNNVRGTRNVLEAASRAGIGTVVFASSNHVVGMYETEYAPGLYAPEGGPTVDHRSPIRPDSDYGASKAAGEAWCRLYAERDGIDCYALRIGSVRDPAFDHPFGDAERAVGAGECERGDDDYETAVARMRCTWLSRRDCAALVDACLDDGTDGRELETTNDGSEGETGDSAGEGNPDTVAGGAFEVFYGVSDNPNGWFDLSHARERVGYEPTDSGNAMSEPPA